MSLAPSAISSSDSIPTTLKGNWNETEKRSRWRKEN